MVKTQLVAKLKGGCENSQSYEISQVAIYIYIYISQKDKIVHCTDLSSSPYRAIGMLRIFATVAKN